jgi:hypothetical protein
VLERWNDEFRDVAMERHIFDCRDGATNFAMSHWNESYAMSRWGDEFRDGVIELQIPRCHDGATNYVMMRWSNAFFIVAMELSWT